MITIEEYSSFFLSIILGLGISFELPILIFFLALFGIVSPKFLWKNYPLRSSDRLHCGGHASAPAPTHGPCASTPCPCWRSI
jgi:hypothetical protein